MRCKKCNKIMVPEEPLMVNLSIPISRCMRCKCGNKQVEYFETIMETNNTWEERWEKANK